MRNACAGSSPRTRCSVYPALIVATTALVVALPALIASATGLGGNYLAWLILAALFPASDVATTLVNGALSRRFVPRYLLRYRCGEVPAEARTFVVVPCLLTNEATIRALCVQLESHYLSNGKGAVHFALLTDWVDSPRARRDDDEPLLATARLGLEALNRKYPMDGLARFQLLHRGRRWNEQERCFMGWERKRGKLHELNRLLRGDRRTRPSCRCGTGRCRRRRALRRDARCRHRAADRHR